MKLHSDNYTTHRCSDSFFVVHFVAKVSEGTNSNMPAKNTLVQLLALYTKPESHNAQRHRQTDVLLQAVRSVRSIITAITELLVIM